MKTQPGKLKSYFSCAVFCAVFCTVFSLEAQSGANPAARQLPKIDPFEFEIPAEAMMNEVKERRNVLETNIFQLVRMGDRFFHQFKFSNAYRSYTQALNVFENQKMGSGKYIQGIKKKIEKRVEAAHKAWAESIFTQARRLYTSGMTKGASVDAEEIYAKAKQTALQAYATYYLKDPKTPFKENLMKSIAGRDSGFYERIEKFLNDCTRMINSVKFQMETALDSEGVDPDNKRRKQEIDRLMKNARVYYRQKEYESVRKNVEKILAMDPYNEAAITLLEKTYQKLYKIAAYRRQTDAEEKVTDIDWKWVEPYNQKDKEDLVAVEGDVKGMESPAIANTGNSNTELENRLQRIILPELEFIQEKLSVIINTLNETANEIAKKNGIAGVNIIPEQDLKEVRINSLKLNNASLLVWLKYLCRLAKANRRLDGNDVIIGRSTGELETHSYPISNFYAERIRTELGGEGGKKKEEKEEKDYDAEMEDFSNVRDELKGKEKVSKTIDPEKLKEYFIQRGVRFGKEDGSGINYDPESGRLTMRNTKEDHERLADRIKVLDVPAAMVLVEAKMMEITMSAMEELGFDWSLAYDATAHNKKFISSGKLPYGQVYSRSSDTSNVLINNLNLIPNAGGSRNINLFLTIRAIDRCERSEVVTMPRLIALSGQSASLNIGDERSFPSDYDEAEVEINSNGNTFTYTPPNPDFEKEQVGMQFNITPTVYNYRTINVNFNTQIKKFIGWSNYDYTIKIGKMFESIADTSTQNIQPKEKMAEFADRRIITQVDVYDGESVVIGGVLQDETSKVDDKYPLLGDLPLIGRLFTDRSNSSTKTNLMVFVTARIIGGDGLPYNKEKRDNGIFNFVNR